MKFRKKPVVIDAIQVTAFNINDIHDWASQLGNKEPWFINRGGRLEIPTLEGTLLADIEDWIICGVQGEFYPCKPDIFVETYEEVDQ